MPESHYFTPPPGSAGTETGSVELLLPDVAATLTTAPGVFSKDALDTGTRLLLLDGPRPPKGPATLLDLGCGYGPIAVTLALRAPEATVWAVDVNPKAVELTARNATAAGVANVVACEPDAVPDHLVFDGIWSNPPIRIGKDALHTLLRRWLDRLAPAGFAALVVQKHLGSDSLTTWLEREAWPTVRLGSRAGYRLLRVSRP